MLVPGYHAQSRVNNNVCHGFTLLSDDGGRTFRLGATVFGDGDKHSNECQAVQLRNRSVLMNARSLSNPFEHQHRIQAISHDGGVHGALSTMALACPTMALACPRRRAKLHARSADWHNPAPQHWFPCIPRTVSVRAGQSFGPTSYVPALPQPIGGCEGSMIRLQNGTILLSGPDSTLLRTGMCARGRGYASRPCLVI